MSIIRSKDVVDIILKTLGIVDPDISRHGEITAYLLYKLLKKSDIEFTKQELLDYVLIGLLHDIGLYQGDVALKESESEEPGPHSLYGYLFVKFLSPLGDKADIIKYHHVNLNRYSMLQMDEKDKKVLKYLSVVDKMEQFRSGILPSTYFKEKRDITFSGHVFDLFMELEAKEHVLENLGNGSYKEEMNHFWQTNPMNERYKDKFLEMLVYTIDFRSEVTVIHTMSTVNFAEQLGKLLRLSPEEIKHIHYGALLHDLGKIAIPLKILESTSRLSDKEMEVMKSHVKVTEYILEDFIHPVVLQLAVRHHEKLDGSGYPYGLEEKDLTLSQQIIAVADILSALYSKRSYKESFDKDKIISILQSDIKGKKISVPVVVALMANYDSVIKKYERKKSEIMGIYFNIKKDYEDLSEIFKNIV
ncbi:MAG: HD domain-containing protein [Lachnospiraceae bacterium]|nr:HD domain-containing protein [Lachnospiraceae bacterium]